MTYIITTREYHGGQPTASRTPSPQPTETSTLSWTQSEMVLPRQEIVDLINPRIALTKYLGGAFEVSENSVKYNGEEVHGVLVQRILECHRNGLPLDPLLRFFENLERNDSRRARTELYTFLAHGTYAESPQTGVSWHTSPCVVTTQITTRASSPTE
jgi:hypothetical protein